MTVFFEFHIAHSEVLLITFADQFLYNLSLIKVFLACVKQNPAVKTAIDACSLLARQTFYDRDGQYVSSLIISSEQVTNISLFQIFHFFLTIG